MRYLLIFILFATACFGQIVYPVDPATDRFTVLVDGEVHKRGQIWPKADGSEITDLAANVTILQEVVEPAPVSGVDYDPATHRVGQGAWTDDIPNETATFSRPIVALTQAELDAIAVDEDRQTKAVNLNTAIATLRQWSDDAEGTTVTSGNAVNVLQTVVTRLGVFFDRFADLLEVQQIGE